MIVGEAFLADLARVLGRFLDGRNQPEAGVLDEHIDAAEAGDCGLDRFTDLRLVRDVDLDGQQRVRLVAD
jgi:hypothetical protein